MARWPGAIIALRWVWDRPRRGGSTAYASDARRRQRARLRRLRLLRQSRAALRRADPGMAVGDGRWPAPCCSCCSRLNPSAARAAWPRRARRRGDRAAFALVFPQCLGRPEQVSPELAALWLDNVREAKPIYQHPFRTAFPIVALPVIGAARCAARDLARARAPRAWSAGRRSPCSPPSPRRCCSGRPAPARRRRLLAVPGATALAWIVLPWCLGSRFMPVRVFGTVARLPHRLGAVRRLRDPISFRRSTTSRAQTINTANARCPTLRRSHPSTGCRRDHLHLRRSRPAADHRHPPRRRRRPLSPQRRCDPRRAARLSRHADAFRAIAQRHGATCC